MNEKRSNARDELTLLARKDTTTGLDLPSTMELRFPVEMKKTSSLPHTFVTLQIRGLYIYKKFYGKEKLVLLLKEAGIYLRTWSASLLLSSHYLYESRFYFLYTLNTRDTEEKMKQLDNFLKEHYPDIDLQCRYGIAGINDPAVFAEVKDRTEEAAESSSLSERNPFSICSMAIHPEEEREKEILADFPAALEDGSFVPLIQGIYDTNREKVLGGEVLVRWVKKGVALLPGDFIPILERNGAIRILDTYMLEKTVSVLRKELDQGKNPLPLSVNLSAIDFYDRNLFPKILSVIDSSKIPHDLLILEIPKAILSSPNDNILSFLADCRKNHIGFYTDFTGNESLPLEKLKEYGISAIKVDVRGTLGKDSSPYANATLRSLANLASFLEIPVIFLGIDRKEALPFFLSVGASNFQGYYFLMPLSVEEFVKDVQSRAKSEKKTKPSRFGLLRAIQDPVSDTSFLFQDIMNPLAVIHSGKEKITLVEYNKAFQILLGLEAKMQGKALEDILSKERAEKTLPLLYKLLSKSDETGTVFPDGLRYVDETGISYDAKVSVTELGKDEEGGTYLLQLNLIPAIEGASKHFDVLPMESYRILFSNLPEGVFLLDRQGKVLYRNHSMELVNPALKTGFSFTAAFPDLLKDCPDFLSSGNRDGSSFLSSGYSFHVQDMHSTLEPIQIVYCKKKTAPVLDDQSKARESLTRLKEGLFGAIEYYAEIDLNKDTYFLSFLVRRPTNYSLPEDGSYHDGLLKALPLIDTRDQKKVHDFLCLRNLKKMMKDKEKRSIITYKLSGIDRWIKISLTLLKEEDRDTAVVVATDYTDTVLKDMDSLTSCSNQINGRNKMEQFLSQHRNSPMGFAMMDIDFFKKLNDDYGHSFGDECLRKVGRALISLTDSHCYYPTRLGGDEFSFLFDPKEITLSEIEDLLRPRIEKIGEALGITTPLRVSLGASYTPVDGTEFSDLYVIADQRMYLSKAEHHALREE